jgi:CheY-like chemotaxis protein
VLNRDGVKIVNTAKTKWKVLLVEDDQSFVDAVTLLLRNEPIEIVVAKTGGEAIRRFKIEPESFALAPNRSSL